MHCGPKGVRGWWRETLVCWRVWKPKPGTTLIRKVSMGLSKWLKVLVHICPRLPTIVVILWRKFPLGRGPQKPQKCTIVDDFVRKLRESGLKPQLLSTSDFQSEVGEVFSEIGGELPAKFGRRFSSFFCWENSQKHFPPKLHRKFHHQTSLRGSGLWRALHTFESPHLDFPE